MRVNDVVNNLLYLKQIIKTGKKPTVSIAEETIDEAVRYLSDQKWTPSCVALPQFKEGPDKSRTASVSIIATIPGNYTVYLRYCRRQVRGKIVERFENDNGIYHGPILAWMYFPEPWRPGDDAF